MPGRQDRVMRPLPVAELAACAILVLSRGRPPVRVSGRQNTLMLHTGPPRWDRSLDFLSTTPGARSALLGDGGSL